MPETIKIHGARVHNLKNIDVDVPLNQIVAIAGGPAPGSPPWPWGSSTQRAPGATWSLSPPTPAGA